MPQSRPNFAEIIDTLPRQEFVSSVVCAIEKKYGYGYVTEDSDRVPRPFRLVGIVESTTGFLGHGGLDKLLQLPCRITYTTYLAELGFKEVGSKIRRYVRWNLLFSYARTRNVEKLLYRHNERIYDSVGQYIVDHASKFKTLLPQIRETLTYLERFDPAGYEKKICEPDPYIASLQALTEDLESGEIDAEDALRKLRDLQY